MERNYLLLRTNFFRPHARIHICPVLRETWTTTNVAQQQRPPRGTSKEPCFNTAAEHTPTIHLLSLNTLICKSTITNGIFPKFSMTKDEWSEHIPVAVEE